MSKREKIILIVMAIVVVYGAYEFFFASAEEDIVPTGEAAGTISPGSSDMPQFLAGLSQKLPSKTKENNHKIILKKAVETWGKDPFLPQAMETSNKDDITRTPLATGKNLIYSGYLEIGNKRLAIINGLEYEVSEIIDPGGYVLKNISPGEVRVGYASGNISFVIPLEEVD